MTLLYIPKAPCCFHPEAFSQCRNSFFICLYFPLYCKFWKARVDSTSVHCCRIQHLAQWLIHSRYLMDIFDWIIMTTIYCIYYFPRTNVDTFCMSYLLPTLIMEYTGNCFHFTYEKINFYPDYTTCPFIVLYLFVLLYHYFYETYICFLPISWYCSHAWFGLNI